MVTHNVQGVSLSLLHTKIKISIKIIIFNNLALLLLVVL